MPLACRSSGEYHSQFVKDELSIEVAGQRSGKLTAREKRIARLWKTAPWLALAGVTLTPPVALLLVYLISGFSPLFLVFALTSVPFSLIAAIIVTLTLLFLRRRWARDFRDRLSDGVTADEVGFFLPNLPGERKLREMGSTAAAGGCYRGHWLRLNVPPDSARVGCCKSKDGPTAPGMNAADTSAVGRADRDRHGLENQSRKARPGAQSLRPRSRRAAAPAGGDKLYVTLAKDEKLYADWKTKRPSTVARRH